MCKRESLGMTCWLLSTRLLCVITGALLTSQVLLCTDSLGHGLDIDGVDVVVNFERPDDARQYAKRAGRTGRMGAPGTVVTLLEAGHVKAFATALRSLGLEAQEAAVTDGVFGPVPLQASGRAQAQAAGAGAGRGQRDGEGGAAATSVSELERTRSCQG